MSGDESTCVLEDLEVNHQTAELEPQSKPQQEAQEPAGSGDEAHLEEPMARHERQNSCTSIASTLSLSGDFCKICHCGGEPNAPLIAPCFCSGSLKHVHQDCLQKWIKSSDIKRCELCKYPFAMQSKVKPFSQWEKLDMTSLERRKLLCSVSFHVVAITCVVWSLYILIDRTADEIEAGDLKWPFWTKLVVVAIGFSGGLIFMYIQCKVYIHLCKKWKAYNRIIVVQEAPEEVHKPALKFSLKATQRQSCSKVTTEDDQQSTHTNTAAAAEAGECSLTTATTSMVDARVGRSRSNAETQTALRGVSLMAGGDLLEARVVPVSTLFQDMDRNQPGQGPFFFSECECDNNLRHGNCCKSSSLSAPTSRDGTLKSRCQSRTLTRNDAARTGSWHERRASLRCTLLPGEALHLHSRTPSERIPNTPEP